MPGMGYVYVLKRDRNKAELARPGIPDARLFKARMRLERCAIVFTHWIVAKTRAAIDSALFDSSHHRVYGAFAPYVQFPTYE